MASPSVDLSQYTHPRTARYLALRGLWFLVEFFVYPKRFRRLKRIRIAILRVFGADIGKNCYIGDRVRIWEPWNLTMGDYAVLGDQAEVYNLAKISLGANAVVSQYAFLCSATHDHTRADFPLTHRPISIGAGAWVAAKALVGPGVTVGEGAVLGAMSVTFRDIPAFMIYAGNPAVPIKPRVIKPVRA